MLRCLGIKGQVFTFFDTGENQLGNGKIANPMIKIGFGMSIIRSKGILQLWKAWNLPHIVWLRYLQYVPSLTSAKAMTLSFCVFTKREAAWSCRGVGSRMSLIYDASLFVVAFLTFLKVLRISVFF